MSGPFEESPKLQDPGARQGRLVLYRDGEGEVPVLRWLDERPPRARAKCFVRLERLETRGKDLRRSETGFLDRGLYELRVRHVGEAYRLLYFFHGLCTVVVTHGIVLDRKRIPPEVIENAIECKRRFEADPGRHTFVPEARS